ncbi:hypothetical protein N7461_002258 [Penicillium sp. DV-2018c]|nr:hypothetical protein N7461_002258 [Penicillium sp. DV-2018c]
MGVSEIKTSSVPLLITKHQWLDWHSKITLELRKAGYGQLLRQKRNVVRTTTSTNADADTPDISQTANGSAVVTWIAIQDRAVATVLDCLGGDLQTKFEGETKVQELLDNLKKHLQPHSNAIVNDAVSRLATLTYKTDAQDLSHEFEDIMRQFEQVGITLPPEIARAFFDRALYTPDRNLIARTPAPNVSGMSSVLGIVAPWRHRGRHCQVVHTLQQAFPRPEGMLWRSP